MNGSLRGAWWPLTPGLQFYCLGALFGQRDLYSCPATCSSAPPTPTCSHSLLFLSPILPLELSNCWIWRVCVFHCPLCYPTFSDLACVGFNVKAQYMRGDLPIIACNGTTHTHTHTHAYEHPRMHLLPLSVHSFYLSVSLSLSVSSLSLSVSPLSLSLCVSSLSLSVSPLSLSLHTYTYACTFLWCDTWSSNIFLYHLWTGCKPFISVPCFHGPEVFRSLFPGLEVTRHCWWSMGH